MSKPADPSVQVGSDGVLHLAGRIGYANADVVLPKGRSLLADGRVERIDLSLLDAPDSATLGILLVWAAEASRAQRRLRIHGLPEGLRSLMHLCDAEALLQAA